MVGRNAGPALEVIVGGLELATLVFMNLEENEDGEIDIKGQKYSEMDLPKLLMLGMVWKDSVGAVLEPQLSVKRYIPNPLTG